MYDANYWNFADRICFLACINKKKHLIHFSSNMTLPPLSWMSLGQYQISSLVASSLHHPQ